MDSIKLWLARLVVLTASNVILVAILQITTGTFPNVVNDIPLQSILILTYLLLIAIFQLVYRILKIIFNWILKERMPDWRWVTYLERWVPPLFFLFLNILFLSNMYTLSFLTIAGFSVAIFLVVSTICSFSLLTESRIDTIIHNEKVESLAMFFAGGIITGVLLVIISFVLRSWNIQISDRDDALFFIGFFVGAIAIGVSIFERKQRLTKCIGQVTFYSEVLVSLGREQSFLLDSMTPYGNDYVIQDPIRTKERMEHDYPWLLFSFFGFLLFFMSLVYGILNSPESIYLTAAMGLAAIIFLWMTVNGIMSILDTNSDYSKWRVLWSEFTELLKLRSMSKEAALMEYSHRIVINGLEKLEMTTEEPRYIIETLLEELSLTEQIPDDLSRQRKLLTNLVILIELKTSLDEPHKYSIDLENELKYLEKAKAIYDSVQSLQLEGLREQLVLGAFYASLPYEFDVPVEMLRDIVPLLTQDWTKNEELLSQCSDQLQYLESTPRRIIPNSLKLIPVALPIALWLSTIILG